jgi:hypothetical protein
VIPQVQQNWQVTAGAAAPVFTQGDLAGSMSKQCRLAGAGTAHHCQHGRSRTGKEVADRAALREILIRFRERADFDLLRWPGGQIDVHEDFVQFGRERSHSGQIFEIDKTKPGQDELAVLPLKSRDFTLKKQVMTVCDSFRPNGTRRHVL